MEAVPNPNGTPETLVPVGPGNTIAAKHAVYSDRLREPRSVEIADLVLSAPWADEGLDAISALELGRILALIERIDEAIAERRLGQRTQKLVDQRLAASRRLTELLDRHGMTPQARADWTARLTSRSAWQELRDEIEGNHAG
jgi:hypothetical protein